MKKIKIMLLSLLVLAVAGGTMAFNARFTQQYCTTNPIVDELGNITCPTNPLSCPLLQNSKTTTDGVLICTTTKPAAGCAGIRSCIILTLLITD